MAFLIFAIDYEAMDDRRESLRENHRAHLCAQGKKLLGSGALLADDRKTVIGGLSILDTDSREEAEEFANSDPYAMAGIRKSTEIVKWRRRWLNGQFVGEQST